jgi:hypothetical protein|tara:strand:+ start:237 stop:461 length:225 start_codon:yes stop_codon:yes gene_type:complete
MKFIQYKDGSCDLKFSFKERITLFIRGKIIFTPTALKYFGNNLMKILVDFQNNFDEDLKRKMSESNEIDTKNDI